MTIDEMQNMFEISEKNPTSSKPLDEPLAGIQITGTNSYSYMEIFRKCTKMLELGETSIFPPHSRHFLSLF